MSEFKVTLEALHGICSSMAKDAVSGEYKDPSDERMAAKTSQDVLCGIAICERLEAILKKMEEK
jgi:hypothetical protein